MKSYQILFFLILFSSVLIGQKELLQSGPMIGYSEMREVPIWVQTNASATVKIIYWDKENTAGKIQTNEITTQKETAFTALLHADEVEPGRKYRYQLFINDNEINFSYPLEFQTKKLWQWRDDAPDFSFAAGSCNYVNEEVYDRPGNPYGGGYEIFQKIYEKKPDFMLWMGDNYYLREADWNTRTGIFKRFTHTRSLKEMQPLLASIHNYAIWDDHDFGPNNSDRSFLFKETTLEAFRLFWANPGYGINGKPGTTTKFEWADVDFFLLDNRYNRAPNERKTGKKLMFGDEQLEWLIDALINSTATFKIIAAGGQMLNPKQHKENLSRFPEEYEKLLNSLAEEGITGIIFFSGDIHSSEITKLEREGTYPLYEFTISPLTAGPFIPEEETNPLRIPGYKTNERNFAHFSVTGPKNNRVLSCINYNTEGKEMWHFNLNENELK